MYHTSERHQRVKDNTMKTLKSVEKKLKRTPYVPVYDDPRAELRRLVRSHAALTRASVQLGNMSSDREKTVDQVPPGVEFVSRKEDATQPVFCYRSGGTIFQVWKCVLPEDDKADLHEASRRRSESASKLESAMIKNLKRVPIYTEFLSKVFGCGPVVSAYIVAMVDIRKSEKPSQLKRYFGFAVMDGRLERRSGGPKTGITGNPDATGTYNDALRTRMYQMFSSLWKNAAKSQCTSKYLIRWTDSKARMLIAGKTKGEAHSAGWHKAAELFLYDLYLVWRAIEGLPSWVTWYDWARGYEHGQGQIQHENAPRMLTVEHALELVGNVGKLQAPMPVAAE